MELKFNFEEWLSNHFMANYAGLDDDSPEAFEAWFAGLDTAEIVKFTNKFAADCVLNVEPY